MKKVLSLLLVIVMICSTFAGLQITSSAATLPSSGSCGTNVRYTFNSSTGLLTINGSGAMTNYSTLDSPFYNQTGIKTVAIESSVTSIGNDAFYGCSGLRSITIPNSVTSIGNDAFYGCNGLTGVTIPNSVTSIGNDAFYGCSRLTSITIPDSVTSIGDYAFSGCSGLTRVTIGNSVKSIGNSAFSGCSGLKSITIGNSVTSIGSSAFYGTAYYKNDLNWDNGVLYINQALIYAKTSLSGGYQIRNNTGCIANSAFSSCNGLTSITIPDSVTSIGDNAFFDCSKLTSVTIPDSVTSTGNYAFKGCSGLKSITIGNSVTSIGRCAFWDCSGLTSVTVGSANTKYDSRNNCNAIIETATNTIITGCQNTVIPDSVTSIGDYAFEGCSGLTSITIGNSVTSIGNDAFYGCSRLTSITVGSANTKYDSRNNCNAIIETATNTIIAGCQNTVLPDSVTNIGNYAFDGCSALTSITIPNSVKSIGDYAFRGCSGLTNVTIGISVTSIGSSAFSGCNRLTGVTIPDSVTSIGSSAFSGCNRLTGVTIPDSVTSIGNYAFYGTAYYKNDLNWDNGVLYINQALIYAKTSLSGGYQIRNNTGCIANSAFSGCNELTSITIPDSVTSIGDNAFFDCSKLTSVIIPDSVTSIGNYAFKGCSGLTSITIGNSVTSIGNYAFYHCSGLTSVTIPDSVTSIGSSAFSGCNRLTGVTIPDSVTSIGNYAFYGCNELTGITIPDSVTSIGDYAFFGCSGLTNVTIGNSVTNIGNYAFENCSSLTSVTIGNSVKSIGDSAFSGCSGLTSITIPNSVATLEANALSGLTNCKKILILGKTTSIKNVITDLPSGAQLYVCHDSAAETVAQLNNVPVQYIDANCADTGNHIPSEDKYLHKAATCTETGAYYYDCLLCGKLAKTEVILALGHQYKSAVTTKPTCTEQGVRTYTCIACSDSYTEPIAALGHKWDSGAVTTEPTCTEKGTKTFTCTVCESNRYEDVAALGHIFKIVNHEDGSLNYVYCERSKTETVDASLYPQSEHNYDNNTNKTYNFSLEKATKLVVKFSASTKVENLYDNIYLYNPTGALIGKYTGSALAGTTLTIYGDKFSVKLVSDSENTDYGFSIDSIVATISLCDYRETQHTFGPDVVTKQPTCTEKGVLTNTCQTCGYVKTTEIVPNGHSYTDVVTKPTCTQKGYTTHTCSVCGHMFKDNYTDILPHSYVDKRTEPTCMQTGYTTHTCTVCGYIFKDNYTDMVPHSYADEITEPTCTEKGFTTHTCTVCGNNYKDTQTNALGHSYKRTITKASVSANGKIVSTCVRCGQIQTEVIYYPKTITISKTVFNYNKKVQKPTVKVTGSNGKEISANNYTLTYSKGSKNVGKYAVKVTFKGNYSGSKTVYYYIQPVVSPSSKALYMGQTLKIKTLSNKACTFASSNKKVATVDKKGVVTAKDAGTATIVVKANGVGNKVTIKVAKPCLTLNKTSASIYIKGKLQLKATTKPGGQKVKWSSSNTKVATVNSNGVVVGIKAGKANITATYVYKGKTYKNVCKIIIKNPVLNDSIITLYNGWSYTLSVIGGSGTIKWSSSNQKVAMVNSSGKVVGNQMGVCYVYATRNGFKMKCKVTVSPYNKECMYYFAFKYGYSGYGFLDIGAVFGAQPLYSTIRNGSIYYSYYISDLGTAYWRSTFVALLEEEGFYYYQGFYINGSPGEVGTKMIYLTTSNGVVNIQYSIYPF